MSTVVQPRAKSLQDDPQTRLGVVVIWRETTGVLHDKTRQGCDDEVVAMMPANQPSAGPWQQHTRSHGECSQRAL